MADTGKTILLVEDEGLIALGEARQLSKAGYRVVHCFTGEEALELVSSDPAAVDLILMDIDLGPGWDGTRTAREILARYEIPLLFLSGHQEEDIVERTEEITNYGYVVKSSSFTVLQASIKMAFKLFAAHRQLDLSSMEIDAKNRELRAALDKLERSSRELSLSEDKFSKAFNLNPDSININRLADGLYLDINEGFTQLMGYSRAEVIGRSSLPGDLDIWVNLGDRECLVEGLRRRGEVSNLEAEFRKKDGSTGIGLMSARVIDINGEKCILSITREVTEWKRLQKSLKETEARFRTAFEQSPIGVALLDADGKSRMLNRGFCALLGYSRAEALGADLTGLTMEEDRPRIAEHRGAAIAHDQGTTTFPLRLVHKDGHVVPTEASLSVVRDEAGAADYHVLHVIDVTRLV
ncbi:MAG TPA: PAS domain S-box protein [Rectinemataceae bacterium]|nr:PAS domain S-box protein [Rectinemataceae bacterium]